MLGEIVAQEVSLQVTLTSTKNRKSNVTEYFAVMNSLLDFLIYQI